ncbi:MAG: biopolymer transporter ExbD [Bdellovibrionaceae bacterium]|nr:biopolymer transporter ExbD [Pseudobdellovibrionaceae bacterium]
MAIHVPGKRDRRNRRAGAKRTVMVVLSLTAMVDMFTVLTIFLLQNFKVDAIKLKQNVPLPEASAIKKLQPAHVVVVTQDKIFLDEQPVADFIVVKEQQDWVINALKEGLELKIKEAKEKHESSLQEQLKSSLRTQNKNMTPEEIEEEEKERKKDWGRVTVQADKEVDFLTIKKVLYTATEAGATLINFAVTQKAKTPIKQ